MNCIAGISVVLASNINNVKNVKGVRELVSFLTFLCANLEEGILQKVTGLKNPG